MRRASPTYPTTVEEYQQTTYTYTYTQDALDVIINITKYHG